MSSRMIKDRYGGVSYLDKDGKFHNENGPALITSNGTREYYIHGKKHNSNGPAKTYMTQKRHLHKEYWFNNIRYPEIKTNEEWEKLVIKLSLLGL